MTEDRTLVYRRLFGRFATGVAVILAEDEEKLFGLTVNSLTSASLNPLLLLFCARNESQSATAILRVGTFSVNVLSARQEIVARHFAGSRKREIRLNCEGKEGFVWLRESNAVFRCEVEAAHPGGDHRIILGRVIDMLGPEECQSSLLYHQGRYIDLKAKAKDTTAVGTR